MQIKQHVLPRSETISPANNKHEQLTALKKAILENSKEIIEDYNRQNSDKQIMTNQEVIDEARSKFLPGKSLLDSVDAIQHLSNENLSTEGEKEKLVQLDRVFGEKFYNTTLVLAKHLSSSDSGKKRNWFGQTNYTSSTSILNDHLKMLPRVVPAELREAKKIVDDIHAQCMGPGKAFEDEEISIVEQISEGSLSRSGEEMEDAAATRVYYHEYLLPLFYKYSKQLDTAKNMRPGVERSQILSDIKQPKSLDDYKKEYHEAPEDVVAFDHGHSYESEEPEYLSPHHP